MIRPRYWIKHALVRRALRNYPLYDVPHKRAESTLREDQVQENFAYFMRVRQDRLAFFRSWLQINFWLKADLDGEGVRKLSRWVDGFGGGLIGSATRPWAVYECYQPLWTHDYAGYNVMLDIGLFLGEYLIAKRPKLYWEIYRGHEVEPETLGSPSYLKPCLGGMPRLLKDYPLRTGYGVVADSRKLATIQHYRPPREAFIRSAQAALYASNIPDGTELFVFGDSRNEPL